MSVQVGVNPEEDVGRRTKMLAATLTLMAACDHALATPADIKTVLEDATILGNPVRPPFVSGIIAVCTRIQVKTKQGEIYPVYLIYLDVKQFIPKSGDKCRIAFHIEKFCDEAFGDPPLQSPKPFDSPRRIVSDMSCTGQ